jgi:hypothetical protein
MIDLRQLSRTQTVSSVLAALSVSCVGPTRTTVATATDPVRPSLQIASGAELECQHAPNSAFMALNYGGLSCSFPKEGPNGAVQVTLRVCVRSDGTPTAVVVEQDPGLGFVDELRRCLISRDFVAARGSRGELVPGTTMPMVFRFVR